MQTCLKETKIAELYDCLKSLKKYEKVKMFLSRDFLVVKVDTIQVHFYINIRKGYISSKYYYTIEIKDFKQFLNQLKISKKCKKVLLFRILDGVVEEDSLVIRMIMPQDSCKTITTYSVSRRKKENKKIKFKNLKYYKDCYDLVFKMHDSCFDVLKNCVDQSLSVEIFFLQNSMKLKFFIRGIPTDLELDKEAFQYYEPQNLTYVLEQNNCIGICIETFDFQTFLAMSRQNRDCYIYCFLKVKQNTNKIVFYGKSRKQNKWHQLMKVYLDRKTLISNQQHNTLQYKYFHFVYILFLLIKRQCNRQ